MGEAVTTDSLVFLDRDRLELGPAASSEKVDHQHWRLARDEDGIAWLLLDRADSGANTLDEAVLEELDLVLEALEHDPPKALVLRSGKRAGFCVGADVGMFRGETDTAAVAERLRRGHVIVDRLAELPVPTIAVVHGPCLGGGLELALACDYRLAVEGASLGFPEVMLGLHPGLGGTFRTPRLINPVDAMILMLTGKSVGTGRARALGLVDAVTQERHVANAVRAASRGDVDRSRRPFYAAALDSAWTRPLIARRMSVNTEKKVDRKHYPSPYQLIDLWQHHAGDVARAREEEIQSFAGLVTSKTGQNLIRVFFLREALKKAGGENEGDAIDHVHVVGAGTMGGDIAGWCALSGFRVTLSDMDPAMIAGAVKRARQLCRRKHRSDIDTRDILDRLIPDTSGSGIARADLIIEAVPEKIDIKRSVYREIEQSMKAGAILATNTSSIPLETLRSEVAEPARFLGLHFFNPVAKMQLVELVSHDGTDAGVRDRARAFVAAIDRLPVPVRSAPGFLVNRVLTPYLLEAMLLLDEGIAPETLDRAAVDFGMPMGPIELADQVGLDICLDVAEMLRDNLGGDIPEVPAWVRDKVEKGDTGRKSGRGFYAWSDDGPRKNEAATPPKGTVDRLVLPLLNTCVACLREEVVADPDALDAAVIFGTGFAPFRGGPLHYARERGVDDIVGALEKLAEEHGPRFAPDKGWQQLR